MQRKWGSYSPCLKIGHAFQINFYSPECKQLQSPEFILQSYPRKKVTFLYICVCLVAQSCPTPCDPLEYSQPRLLCPWDFSGQITGVGYHFPPPEDLPKPGIKPVSPMSPILQVDSLPVEPSRKPCICIWKLINSAYSSDSKHSAYSLQKFLENVVSHRRFFFFNHHDLNT